MKPLLCVHNISKTFPGHDRPVIKDVTFCVYPGEVLALVGPSGCGKTTTLRTVMGFEHADAGEVLLGEQVLQREKTFVGPDQRGIGFVFQDYALFPHLSVLENVLFGLRGAAFKKRGGPAMTRRRRAQIAKEALWMVGLMGLEDRMPHDLSGGQQQRVALARAIAPGARVILLDEPFSNLDPDLRLATRNEVRMIAHRAKMAVVLVTHDQEEALSTADRLAVMREGRLVQTGPPEEVYNSPATAFVAQFLGRTNLLEGDATGTHAVTPLGRVELEHFTRGKVLLSLRPEHLSMQPAGDEHEPGALCVGKVVSREFKGHDMTFRIRLQSNRHEVSVQTDYATGLAVGDRVCLKARTPAAVVEPDDMTVQLTVPTVG
ncbi:ABC transporter ATP-binding protein [Phycisphaerales bacterium AB-hyl4]|uniref:ABC transporter ATP-binding protein n=1 Tax=Natronomicrosphaera hydrolytica TaxID=3242702 RepID=A0ABV4U7R8_9BACT